MRKAFIVVSLLYFTVLAIIIIYFVLQNNVETLLSIFFSEEIRFAIVLTLATSITASTLSLILSIPVAYSLANYSFKGKKAIELLTDLPLALPPILLGFALLLFLARNPIVKFLESMGFELLFTPYAIVIALLLYITPEVVKILYSAFSSVDRRYHMVLKTLGYGDFQSFLKVDLPLSAKGIASAFIVALARSIGAFGAILLVSGAIKGKTETLSIAIFLNWQGGNMDAAIAAATVLILISLILFYIFERIKK